jgi:hypothetical protein
MGDRHGRVSPGHPDEDGSLGIRLKVLCVVADQQIAHVLADGKALPAAWLVKKQIAGFVVLARVDLNADCLQREHQRLHRIEPAHRHFLQPIGPLNLIPASPGACLLADGRENADLDRHVALAVSPGQGAVGDEHDSLGQAAIICNIGLDALRELRVCRECTLNEIGVERSD